MKALFPPEKQAGGLKPMLWIQQKNAGITGTRGNDSAIPYTAACPEISGNVCELARDRIIPVRTTECPAAFCSFSPAEQKAWHRCWRHQERQGLRKAGLPSGH